MPTEESAGGSRTKAVGSQIAKIASEKASERAAKSREVRAEKAVAKQTAQDTATREAAEREEAEREATSRESAMAEERARTTLTGKGVTGRVEVDDHYVTINRKGVLAKANFGWTRGEKRIAINSITAVQYKKPGLSNGYIQFSVPGGNESTKGIMDATKDENTVLFTSGHRDEFEAIRARVEERIAARFHPQQGVQPTVAAPQPLVSSLGEQIRELGKLRDEGLLTDEEFNQQKQRLLGGGA